VIDTHPHAVTFGWYGKTPAAGDFVSRRLARPVIAVLDRWFQSGMTALRERMPQAWQAYYAKAPVWRALLPSDIVAPQPCLAIVAASSDRVGRGFPFCIVAPLPAKPNGWIRSLPQAGEEISRLVEQSLRNLRSDDFDRHLDEIASRLFGAAGRGDDDIGSVLDDLAIESDDLATVPLNAASAFPWPDLGQRFEAAGTASYWWTGANRAGAGFVHDGALDADLFVTLFGEPCRPT
jgi:type VI secretion system protein ImpM